ncbi:MAG: DUF2848 family protein [Candidatus Binatia bacterium]
MLTLAVQSDGSSISLTPTVVALAGYTGRDRSSVQAHIAELAKLGVEGPKSYPVVLAVTADRLTTDSKIEVLHGETSGEAEFAIVLTGGKKFIAAASDHTDRKNEALHMGMAKQVVPRILSREVWRFDAIESHWDQIALKSYANVNGKRILYQDTTVGTILPVDDIIACVAKHCRRPLEEAVILSGTVPILSGTTQYASHFEVEMGDPVTRRTLRVAYDVVVNDWNVEP